MTDTWRPFEPSRDALKAIERERAKNTCNLHDDCASADDAVREKGGRRTRAGDKVHFAFHFNIEDCEDGC